MSVVALAAVEAVGCALAFLGFCTLRRSEKSRQYLYQHFPRVSNAYYWAEDSISFGQLTGTRLRLEDLRRWTKPDEAESALEAD
ncbi:unnamed protein product [Cylicocyclus nassatus]|uniref:Uncharacterized protein n=1 Tax=Cylicocyclus nassatus TaxID=53992 RepID=A0AA36M2B6_CYLNA|nr:unnamed protein product [Cylicocyclus nassatus]